MKIIAIPFSGGGLGKGTGADSAPEKIMEKLSCKAEYVVVDEYDVAGSNKKIEEHVQKVKEKCVLLGGDHSITSACVKGFAKNNPDPWFICFDAHPDLMHDFDPPTHEDYLRVLIEQKVLNTKKIILVGLRKWDQLELDYLKEKKIKYYTADDVKKLGISLVLKEIKEIIDENVYLSIDIDVIDPKFAPGTGFPEPEGLLSDDIIEALKSISAQMIDLVEINPSRDIDEKTVDLAAKLIQIMNRNI